MIKSTTVGIRGLLIPTFNSTASEGFLQTLKTWSRIPCTPADVGNPLGLKTVKLHLWVHSKIRDALTHGAKSCLMKSENDSSLTFENLQNPLHAPTPTK